MLLDLLEPLRRYVGGSFRSLFCVVGGGGTASLRRDREEKKKTKDSAAVSE